MPITVFSRFKFKEIFLLNEKIYTKFVYNIFLTCKYKLKLNKTELNPKPTSLNLSFRVVPSPSLYYFLVNVGFESCFSRLSCNPPNALEIIFGLRNPR